MATAEADLQILMLPKDPKDKSNVFWKFVQERVVMRQPSSQAIYFACTRDMRE